MSAAPAVNLAVSALTTEHRNLPCKLDTTFSGEADGDERKPSPYTRPALKSHPILRMIRRTQCQNRSQRFSLIAIVLKSANDGGFKLDGCDWVGGVEDTRGEGRYLQPGYRDAVSFDADVCKQDGEGGEVDEHPPDR
jgi:hypothetical protein